MAGKKTTEGHLEILMKRLDVVEQALNDHYKRCQHGCTESAFGAGAMGCDQGKSLARSKEDVLNAMNALRP